MGYENLTQKYDSASLFGLNVPGCFQPAWLPYYYTTGSQTQKGWLEVQPITNTGYVVQRIIPSVDVNGVNISWPTANKVVYYTSAPTPQCTTDYKLPDDCDPYTELVTGSLLPEGHSWGWGYINWNINNYSLTNARNSAINYNQNPDSRDDVHAAFGIVSGSDASIPDMTKEIVGTGYPLYRAPFSGSVYLQDGGLLLQYVSDGEPRTQYIAGWSGSLRPQGNDVPVDIIFKYTASTVRRNPNGLGDDCELRLTDWYSLT